MSFGLRVNGLEGYMFQVSSFRFKVQSSKFKVQNLRGIE
jgi:hypothetical protein